MISEKRLEWAVEILLDREGEGAKARAANEYLDDMSKVILAKLMNESNEKTAAAKEMYARSHADFIAHLEQKKAVAEMDYRHRDKKAAASAVIDVWRTQQSNQRTMSKVA